MAVRPGYLALETRSDAPGFVRLFMSEQNPQDHPSSDSAKVRLVMHFRDIESAFYNAQSKMSHHITDLDNNLFKRNIGRAIADLLSLELKHRIIWQDPDLEAAESAKMQDQLQRNEKSIALKNRAITVVKWIAIALLVFNVLVPVISEILYPNN